MKYCDCGELPEHHAHDPYDGSLLLITYMRDDDISQEEQDLVFEHQFKRNKSKLPN